MARSRAARERATGAEEAPAKRKGGALGVLTFLLAAYAAVVGTMSLSKGGGGGGGGASTGSSDAGSLEARLDQEARKVRGEVQTDFEKSLKSYEDRVAKAVKQIEDAGKAWKAEVEKGTKRADDVVRSTTSRSDELDERVTDVAKAATEAKSAVDGLAAIVKDLQERPVAVAPGPRGNDPVGPKPAEPTIPDPAATPPPPTLTPEQIAEQKAKVKAAIADLASPEIAKVYPAATFLGSAGDLDAVAPLAAVLKQAKDSLARTAAATALGTLRACDAFPALLDAFLDKDSGVYLAAAGAVGRITGLDAGLSGGASRRERTDAKDKWNKWWHDNEAATRKRLGQEKGGAPPSDPAHPDAPK